MTRRNQGRERWLTPAGIARASGGKVLRPGAVAARISTDSRDLRPGDCFVALRGDHFDGHGYVAEAFTRGAAGVIVEEAPDPLSIPEGRFVVVVRDTRRALMRIAAEHRRRHQAQVVGVTGSCGKTSTKDMLGHALDGVRNTIRSQASYNNDIGVPLTLLRLRRDTEVAVVEIGSNGPGEVSALSKITQPDIALITCVGEAHLAGLSSLRGVAEEKAGILDGVPDDGVFIVNGDDACCRRIAEDIPQRTVSVRVNQDADWFATDVQFHSMGTSFLLQGERRVTLQRLGSHNVYNALMTIAASQELGVELDPVLEALASAQPTSRRLELKEVGGVTLFDDTYNMNPASARAALAALSGLQGPGRRVVVFGEMHELGERSDELHGELGETVAQSALDVLVTVGDGADPIAAGALAAGMKQAQVVQLKDHAQALDYLKSQLSTSDRVLCKASRRVGLDRLVDGLQRHLEPLGRE